LLEVHNVLNEVVIDRGAYPGPAVLDVFVDQSYVTTGEERVGSWVALTHVVCLSR
jgi:hypothetical protein